MIDPYATHLEALGWALYQVGAGWEKEISILELGCGYYSTPLLAGIGDLDVLTSDQEWGNQFADIADIQIVNWRDFQYPPKHYDLCLLDNEEHAKDRAKRLDHLLDRCDYVVMHDWHPSFEQPKANSIVFQRLEPWTLVAWR